MFFPTLEFPSTGGVTSEKVCKVKFIAKKEQLHTTRIGLDWVLCKASALFSLFQPWMKYKMLTFIHERKRLFYISMTCMSSFLWLLADSSLSIFFNSALIGSFSIRERIDLPPEALKQKRKGNYLYRVRYLYIYTCTYKTGHLQFYLAILVATVRHLL